MKYQKPFIYTKEKILEAFKRCFSIKDFRNNFRPEYSAAHRMGILKELTAQLRPTKKGKQIWFEDTLAEEALKYTCLSDFHKNSSGAYTVATRMGILKKISSHMKRPPMWRAYKIPFLLEYALKFQTRKDLKKNNSSIYVAILKSGIRDKAFSHMRSLGNKEFRCIYGIFFPNKKVYFGLTADFERRKKEHIADSSNRNVKKAGSLKIGKMIKITDYLPESEARKLEGLKETEFESLGWEIFNIASPGGLGGATIKWTKEEILKKAAEFETLQEFIKKYRGAKRPIYKLKISKEVHSLFSDIKNRQIIL